MSQLNQSGLFPVRRFRLTSFKAVFIQHLSNTRNYMKKVLFVLTSHDELGNTGLKTGFWSEELAAPYYTLLDQGVEITLASPKGGQPPVDPKSNLADFQTDTTRRMDADPELLKKLQNTHVLSTMNASDFDAIFYPGGHGPLWDLANDADSVKLITAFYESKKPVGFVCHSLAALKDVVLANGEPLVKGKKVTGFTNSEEDAVELTAVVPFLVEDMLKEKGALYSQLDDWAPYAITDGLLVSGQNPASSSKVAEGLLTLLGV
jgi:putative intracellular protease/amidase